MIFYLFIGVCFCSFLYLFIFSLSFRVNVDALGAFGGEGEELVQDQDLFEGMLCFDNIAPSFTELFYV